MIRNYFKIAWRNLTKRKVFTAINVFGLSMGFASSILIYLFISHHLSFDNFHKDSDNIYRITTEEHIGQTHYITSAPPGFAKVFREEFAYADKVAKTARERNLIIDIPKNNSTTKFKQDISFVEEDFFKIFNFPLLDGSHSISLSDPNTAVITEQKALDLFGKKDVVGETFVLENDKTIKITGVLKDFPETTFFDGDIFVAFKNLKDFSNWTASETWGGITSSLQCFIKLNPNQDMSAIENALLELPKKYRPNYKNKHVYQLQPLSDMHFNPVYGGLNPAFLIIFGIIGLFLIGIASINFINISSAQAFYRSKEIGVRKVLGSLKQQLFWQFLVETLLISFIASCLGFLVTAFTLPSFNTLFDLELTLNSLLDIKFITFFIALLVSVSLLAGSYPGILIARIVPVLALKGKLNHNDTGGAFTRKVLVVTQFSISIILIVATIVISKQITFAVDGDLGFEKESIVMLGIPPHENPEMLNTLKNRLKNIPGVQQVSNCFGSPGAAQNNWGSIIRYNNRPEYEEFSNTIKAGDADYLKLFNIPLVSGRSFFKDDKTTEVMVNEMFVERLGDTSVEEVLGKTLELHEHKMTIVGVFKNFHNQKFTTEIAPAIVTPNQEWYREIAVKLNYTNTKEVLTQVSNVWTDTFSNYIFDYHFLDERVAEQYETEQRYLSLSKLFSGLAILIGCMGIYGLILFFVNQRLKEIGIRKILGSNVRNILALFSVGFIKLILIAGLIAIPITWYVMEQWLQGYAYRTNIEWWYFLIAIAFTLILALITISYQTVKVAISNPVKVLKTE
ncbi:ABC transporter permease [Seonamhaeicola marinus]|uniref:FtsX-like permease family protein n=1 Tax=Seonamhaeicola marinus TaxID=1912246 RepID=A0A5D0J7K5_9FLAO|nr:ABC transporter permease [Seonamhaeicola marinus]TYA92365.1 FtsX-like permease family protein [Seonamhaeicola marinus]